MSLQPFAIANSQIPGAGSSLRLRWPGILNSQLSLGAKLGPAAGNYTVTNTGGFSVGAVLYKGMAALQFGSNNTAWSWTGVANFSWMTERPVAPLTLDHNCYSLRVNAAFVTTGPLVGDYGLLIGCGGNLNNSQMNHFGAATNAGICFGPTDVGTISMRARRTNVGALTLNDVIKTGFDTTQWHTYELRIVTGSPSSDPVLFGLIDGIVVTPRYSWTAAAGLLPNPNQGQGSQPFGYTFGWTNQTGLAVGASNMNVREALITAAQSEAFLY